MARKGHIGYWKSPVGERSYAAAYNAVLDSLPRPTAARDVPTSFGSVHMLEWAAEGSGLPVVLLPGRSSGAPMWADNLPDWIGKRTIYALDPIGDAGLSRQRVPLTGFDDQATWIAETLRAVGIPRAHVVGHSFGGANAAIFALRHPKLVASLTLLEPVMVIRGLPLSAFFWASLVLLPVPQSLKDRAVAQIGGIAVDEVRQRTPMSAMIDSGAKHYSSSLPLPRTLTDAEWRQLTMPVRIDIAGTKSLAGGDTAVSRMRMLLPQATVKHWPEATHSLPMQVRVALDQELLSFWESVG